MLVRGGDPPEPPARPSLWFRLVAVGLVALIAPLSRSGWLPLIRLLVHRLVLVFDRLVRVSQGDTSHMNGFQSDVHGQ